MRLGSLGLGVCFEYLSQRLWIFKLGAKCAWNPLIRECILHIFLSKLGGQVRLASLDLEIYFEYLSQRIWGFNLRAKCAWDPSIWVSILKILLNDIGDAILEPSVPGIP